MRKGITPIISIIVLLLITVALAGAAWTYLSGFMETYTEKSFLVISGSMYCTSNTIYMTLKNMGATDLTSDNFIVMNTDGNDLTNQTHYTMSTIGPKQTMVIKITDCDGTGAGTCGTGGHTIRLGTAAGIQTYSVVC